jgi:NAD(P)-dependent dehydrogenase (short-subunit alcohol dehydrogenase family)
MGVQLADRTTDTLQQSMQGKIAMVTGANSGIGLETAIGLARRGASVVLVCRNAEKGEHARQEIIRKSGNTNAKLMLADFASLATIRKLANEFHERFGLLHVLVNNAGFVPDKHRLTIDGYESTFAVNHLAPFLLTNLLLPALRAADNARIVTVASGAHTQGHIDLNDLMSQSTSDMRVRYCNSKLANILFTTELARRLVPARITANCLHPGVVHTNFASSGPLGWKLFFRLGWLMLRTPEQGAEASVYLASSPDVAGVSGKYFNKCREVEPSQEAQDAHLAKKLWEACEVMVGERFAASDAQCSVCPNHPR